MTVNIDNFGGFLQQVYASLQATQAIVKSYDLKPVGGKDVQVEASYDDYLAICEKYADKVCQTGKVCNDTIAFTQFSIGDDWFHVVVTAKIPAIPEFDEWATDEVFNWLSNDEYYREMCLNQDQVTIRQQAEKINELEDVLEYEYGVNFSSVDWAKVATWFQE